MDDLMRYDSISWFTILVFLVILFSHGNVGFFLHFSTNVIHSYIQLAR